MRRLSLVSLLCCLGVLVVAGAATAASSASSKLVITPSPVYTDIQMGAPAGDDWLTHMGNSKGWRYSSLTQINKANVGTLKEAWHINLGTCATKDAACGSLEANAVVASGAYYIQAPKGDVFALDGATGETLWTFKPAYEIQRCTPTGSCEPGFNIGTGGRKPGVAIGEGKVFVGTADGKLYALDQMMGGIVWQTEVVNWRTGGKISSAPIYTEGKILVGDGAGDNGGASATMQAFSALNGRRLWSWSVIPGPGQPGYKTWSPSTAEKGFSNTNYGGGSMWESPLIDSKLNYAIFGTGNPVPWNSRGPGSNLYTDSIVALDLGTGQLKWYYQTTHHDLWDSDLPNNGIMFTAKYNVNGKMVSKPGVAFVNKYGMTFILDRRTGKPLLPIPEVPVPQSSATDVNTWPTQPIPLADNVLFNKRDKDRRPCTDGNISQTNRYEPYATATAPDGKPFKIGCVYDPYDTEQYVVVPFEMMDWPASSYSPENNTFITCGVTDRATGFEQIPSAAQVSGAFGGIGAGRLGVGDASTANTGNFSALNVSTGKLAFHQHWTAPCYSGSMNTKGGITFVGHLGTGNGQDGKGWLEAVDTKTGASLWSSGPLSAPVGAAPVTYTVNGKQYVSVAVGGQSHNDVSRPAGLTNPARLRDDSIYTYELP